jgi:FMN phosphatase YigB (HAD superfamily)
LFIDDNIDNVTSAKELGINTIKVDKETKLFDEILAILKTTNN